MHLWYPSSDNQADVCVMPPASRMHIFELVRGNTIRDKQGLHAIYLPRSIGLCACCRSLLYVNAWGAISTGLCSVMQCCAGVRDAVRKVVFGVYVPAISDAHVSGSCAASWQGPPTAPGPAQQMPRRESSLGLRFKFKQAAGPD